MLSRSLELFDGFGMAFCSCCSLSFPELLQPSSSKASLGAGDRGAFFRSYFDILLETHCQGPSHLPACSTTHHSKRDSIMRTREQKDALGEIWRFTKSALLQSLKLLGSRWSLVQVEMILSKGGRYVCTIILMDTWLLLYTGARGTPLSGFILLQRISHNLVPKSSKTQAFFFYSQVSHDAVKPTATSGGLQGFSPETWAINHPGIGGLLEQHLPAINLLWRGFVLLALLSSVRPITLN